MRHAKLLPAAFVARYQNWYDNAFPQKQNLLKKLADEGQFPKGMIISCCDSRYNTTSLLNAEEGEFFVHRNIANFVPSSDEARDNHGTAAAIEYAVKHLKVQHILVVGHALCGGVQGCYNICSGTDTSLADDGGAVGKWVQLIKPAFDKLAGTDKADDLRALEKQAVLVSLDNLMTFEFVRGAVEEGRLSLHGLWHDIGVGELHHYNPETGAFEKL